MIWEKLVPKRHEIFLRVLQLEFRKLSTTNVSRTNHYEVLGVKETATQAEIKNAYFELSKLYHPDRISATDENLAKFRAISAAYEVIGNEQARKLYDQGLLKDKSTVYASSTLDENSPIYKFYKERQERAASAGAMGNWSEEHIKAARKQVWDRNEYFRYTEKEYDYLNRKPSRIFVFSAAAILGIIYATHLENHPVERKWKELTKDITF